jgi:hypothetical protein
MISFHIFQDIPYITKERTSQCGGLRSVIDNKVEDIITAYGQSSDVNWHFYDNSLPWKYSYTLPW